MFLFQNIVSRGTVWAEKVLKKKKKKTIGF